MSIWINYDKGVYFVDYSYNLKYVNSFSRKSAITISVHKQKNRLWKLTKCSLKDKNFDCLTNSQTNTAENVYGN